MRAHVHNHTDFYALPLVWPPHKIILCDFYTQCDLASECLHTHTVTYAYVCTLKNLTSDTRNLITPSIFRVRCYLAVFEFFTHCNLGVPDLRGMVVFVLCIMKHLLDQAFHTVD